MLKDIAALVQICFYIVGATIAILTYRSAKRGLLNTINTEYQKRVIDHLHELSEVLYSEFEREPGVKKRTSPYYLTHSVEPIVIRILEQYKRHIENGGTPEEFNPGVVRIPEGWTKFHAIRNKIQSDPFIPDHIAQYVSRFIEHRFKVCGEIVIEEIKTFEHRLKNQEYTTFRGLPYLIESTVERRFAEKGFSYSNIQDEVHNIRSMIKEYLKSFNPLP